MVSLLPVWAFLHPKEPRGVGEGGRSGWWVTTVDLEGGSVPARAACPPWGCRHLSPAPGPGAQAGWASSFLRVVGVRNGHRPRQAGTDVGEEGGESGTGVLSQDCEGGLRHSLAAVWSGAACGGGRCVDCEGLGCASEQCGLLGE